MTVSEMIIASLSKIWHLVPIIISIILIKKFITYKDKKNLINKNEKNKENGLTLDIRTRKKYEELNYEVKDENLENQGITLVMSRDDKTMIFLCNETMESKSIKEEDIKTFHDNASNYIETNNLDEDNVEFRYVIQYGDVLHKSAFKIFKNNSYNCKYVIT